MASLFRRLFGKQNPTAAPQRPRLFLEDVPDYIYAIGDVHGCDDLLEKMNRQIEVDCNQLAGRKWIVMLGDYVDRGPKSASVIDRLLIKPKNDVQRFCLAGNHEEVMLDFLQSPSSTHRWLDFGGIETLRSYGIGTIPQNKNLLKNMLLSHIPEEHIAFLANLPSLISLPSFCFVHAGIDGDVPLDAQTDEVLLWLRPQDEDDHQLSGNFTLIHGHTPVRDAQFKGRRINVDTGAYASGKLSAVRLSRDGTASILTAVNDV